MTGTFTSPLASDLHGFLEWKRSFGCRYERAQFTLQALDRFLSTATQGRRNLRLDQALLTWLARQPNRKPLSVSIELAVIRQFYAYLRRRYPGRFEREPLWPQLPTTSDFVPYVLTLAQVRILLQHARKLSRPAFRGVLYPTLLLMLYCTGIRFGEALRLRIKDVDTDADVLFIAEFKGRSRWVPFHRSLSHEIERYLVARRAFASAAPDDCLFVGANRRYLPVRTASGTIRNLLCGAGLKSPTGRSGPRPYDLRHTFAVHRLTRWYKAGVDLQARLPWLSAYMGHDNILGTEKYLTATPDLLALAGNRFRRRFFSKRRPQ